MNKLNITREAKTPKYVDIGGGFYVNKVGMDDNGNSSVWVSKGSNRSKKIQMVGNIKDKSTIIEQGIKYFQDQNDPDVKKAIEQIKDYYKKYLSSKTATKSYPSQYDAQFIADLTNVLQTLSSAGTTNFINAKSMIDRMEKIRLEKWDTVFGDKSPWSPVRDSKDKVKVKWNKEKSKKLGIE